MSRARDAYDIDGEFYSEPRTQGSSGNGPGLPRSARVRLPDTRLSIRSGFAAFLIVAALLVVVVARR